MFQILGMGREWIGRLLISHRRCRHSVKSSMLNGSHVCDLRSRGRPFSKPNGMTVSNVEQEGSDSERRNSLEFFVATSSLMIFVQCFYFSMLSRKHRRHHTTESDHHNHRFLIQFRHNVFLGCVTNRSSVQKRPTIRPPSTLSIQIAFRVHRRRVAFTFCTINLVRSQNGKNMSQTQTECESGKKMK